MLFQCIFNLFQTVASFLEPFELRRSLSVLGLVPTAANAEEVIKAAPMNLQRVVVDVGNNEGMEKELKFWIKACQMKVLSDTTGSFTEMSKPRRPGADGFRTVTVGYASETLGWCMPRVQAL